MVDSPLTHVEKALAYAHAVIEGKIPACKWVRLACERQLRDLETFSGPDSPFVWSAEAANHICDFIERLPHVEGPLAVSRELADAGEGLIHLEGWQSFALTCAFGWRKRGVNARRFGRIYIEVPKGNGKSAISSGVALYCLAMEGEQGGQIYSAATKQEQAKIVWGVAYKMLAKRPKFAERHGFRIPMSEQTTMPVILHEKSFSRFVPLSRDTKSMDGLNPYLAIIDEVHAHLNRYIYDNLETACTKRPSATLWCITTAGDDGAGICSELRNFTSKILEEKEADESHWGIIYTLDEGDDWKDPASWQKANPNWGVSVQPDKFESIAKKAMIVPSARHTFRTKNLNQWLSAATSWMDMTAYDRIDDPSLQEDDFAADPLWVGLDLATKVDIASKAKLYGRLRRAWSAACPEHDRWGSLDCATCYPETAPLEPHFYVFCEHFLPEAAIERSQNASYSGWAETGWLRVTPGDVTDFTTVRESILLQELATKQLRQVGYDPWQAAQLSQELDAAGVQVVEIRPNVGTLSQPMKDFEALVLSGRLHTNGDPVLRWMVSNVVCVYDQKGNVYPRKPKDEQHKKIDGVVASLMALNLATIDVDAFEPVGFKFLGPTDDELRERRSAPVSDDDW